MTPEQFLERLAAVRIDRSHGGRAPHKPLLLLLALGRVGLGPESRLIPYETADERFKDLWEEFGRPGAPPRVHYPFGRLRNDDRLWEIPEESQLSTGRGEGLRVSEAKGVGITGGFRQDVHDLLSSDADLVSRAAHQILTEHFPPSIHQDVVEAVRFAGGRPPHAVAGPMPRRGRKAREYTPRDPRFRRDVLEAYDERCAVCEYVIRFGCPATACSDWRPLTSGGIRTIRRFHIERNTCTDYKSCRCDSLSGASNHLGPSRTTIPSDPTHVLP